MLRLFLEIPLAMESHKSLTTSGDVMDRDGRSGCLEIQYRIDCQRRAAA